LMERDVLARERSRIEEKVQNIFNSSPFYD